MALLGIDVGTSAIKAGIFSDEGVCLALTSAEYSFEQPSPGLAELDPETLWSNLCTVIRKIVAAAPKQDIAAVALSVHGESFVGLDRNDHPIGPIVLNIDERASLEMDEFVTAFGRERLYEITGLPPHPMYTLPKIAWLRKHAKNTFEKAQRFVCIHDYLVGRATGEYALDNSLASRTMGFDIGRNRWNPALLAEVGLDESRLSRVVNGGVVIGKTRAAVAEQMGLSTKTVWASGGHDQACTSIGAGGLTPGIAVDGTGTFECISVATPQRLAESLALAANLPCARHSAPQRFLSLTYSPGGIVLKWLRDECARDLISEAERLHVNGYDLLLESAPQEPTDLLFFPYLFGTGTPWLNSQARGVIYGLTFQTRRESLAKAALEGVTCEMRWNLEMLEHLDVAVERIVAVGGGSNSSLWMQLKADIFGRQVDTVPGEAACRGAALCASVAIGLHSFSPADLAAAIPSGTRYEPRPDVHARYNDIFEHYKQVASGLYGFQLPALDRHTNAQRS